MKLIIDKIKYFEFLDNLRNKVAPQEIVNGVRNKTDTSIVLFSSKFPQYTKAW